LPRWGPGEAGAQAADREARLGGIAGRVCREIARRTGKETRECVLGHLQRGGTPTNFDRALCTLFGTKAVELVADEKYGQMVAFAPPQMISVPIAAAIGRLRRVDLNGNLVRSARALGICLGD